MKARFESMHGYKLLKCLVRTVTIHGGRNFPNIALISLCSVVTQYSDLTVLFADSSGF